MIGQIKEIYPQDFNEEQKKEYDFYIRQSKLMFPEAEEWTLKLGVEAFIRLGDKERKEISKEQIEEIKSKYDNENKVYETPSDLQLEEEPPKAQFLYSSNIDGENIQT